MPDLHPNTAVLANPAAQGLYHKTVQLNEPQQRALKRLTETAHLVITVEDGKVLQSFFEKTKQENSKLGELYRSLTFRGFIQRLVTKRFDQAYLNGKEIFPRQYTSDSDPVRQFFKKIPHAKYQSKFVRCHFLDIIGTEQDEYDIYKEYLSLEEMSVSGLVLMVITDLVIGRGARGDWKPRANNNWYNDAHRETFYREQAKDSAKACVFSYPAGLEFRDTLSASFDTVYCLISNNSDGELSRRRNKALANPAMGETLQGLYGKKSALSFRSYEKAEEDKQLNPNDWISFDIGKEDFLLYKPAYQAKIERILTQIILAHDKSMAELGMGRVLNIKGLGLGAFGIDKCNHRLEAIFIDAVRKVHGQLAGRLQFITCINLINLPSKFNHKLKLPTPLTMLSEPQQGVRLTMNYMDPTTHYIVPTSDATYGTPDVEVGGVIICGDPATAPGNEARVCHNASSSVGLQADSSDDPAQLYAMAQPSVFDPNANPNMINNICMLSTIKPPQDIKPLNLPHTIYSQIKERLKLPLEIQQSLDFPQSYYNLVAIGSRDIDKVQSLLDDYTKHNSSIVRIFTGHWNRHHVREVNEIVMRIQTGELDTLDNVLHELDKIKLYNARGSLSRRIGFIQKMKMDSAEVADEAINVQERVIAAC